MRRIILALAFVATQAEAHQIWLEQDGKSTRLIFGEYGDNLKEVSPGLLDSIPTPDVFQETAKGNQAVKTTRAKDHILVAAAGKAGESLTAQVLKYPVYDEKEGEKVIGKGKWIPATRLIYDFKVQAPRNTLDIVPNGEANKFKLYFKEKPLAGHKLALVSPNGWMKEFWTDDKGEVTVAPHWKGTYLVEVQYEDKAAGEINGEKYDKASYTSTLTFDNAKGPKTDRPAPAKPNPAS